MSDTIMDLTPEFLEERENGEMIEGNICYPMKRKERDKTLWDMLYCSKNSLDPEYIAGSPVISSPTARLSEKIERNS